MEDPAFSVLVVNAGSSTLKLSVLSPDDQVTAERTLDAWDGGFASAADAVEDAVSAAEVDAVAHRVVHGGSELVRPTRVDADVVRRIEALSPLAPLHQPRAVNCLRAVSGVLPAVPAVACFDTAFHATIPAAAATFALPARWRAAWDLRRFGFHGLSHEYAAGRAAELLGRGDLRAVTCHLGAGASLCATAGGRSQDTTMGFTPLDGLVMATRSGSVDPGLVLWLVNVAGIPSGEVETALARESGLAGLAGGSGDMREVLRALAAGDSEAVLAFQVYVHRLVGAIAAMTSSLGGLDALVFTGGVGEHSGDVRAAVCERLAFLGVPGVGGGPPEDDDGVLSGPGSAVAVLVVRAREDLLMARQARQVLRDG